jgi:glycosidase
MKKYPLLYEINMRCWLRDLSRRAGQKITLNTVPDSEIEKLTQLGFTHVWLMGVWKTGPRARADAIRSPEHRNQYLQVLPDFTDDDVCGSPYAIMDYSVADLCGGDQELQGFRSRLNAAGIKLILDFVPNHFSLDHPWLFSEPDLFVHSPTAAPGTFEQQTNQGPRWLAHGKDPYFPPWSDTVQIDYRRRATQAAMLDLLGRVAERCDGVRCDMAMLVLNEVFSKNWAGFATSDPEPNFEFWQLAISTIKASHPEFLFLAEVYWGLEARLQSLGFDYTYDKELYDRVIARDGAGIQRHLVNRPISEISRDAHFLENHDERRIASALGLEEHRAATFLILALPGMRFIHEGQLTGATKRVPVQLSRRPAEPPNPEIVRMHKDLLLAVQSSCVGQGTAELIKPQPASATDSSWERVIAIKWTAGNDSHDLAIVNFSADPARCLLPISDQKTRSKLLFDTHDSAAFSSLENWVGLSLQPHEAILLRSLHS